MKLLKRLIKSIYEKSPKQILGILRQKLRKTRKSEIEVNTVIPREIWGRPVFRNLIRSQMVSIGNPIILLGDTKETDFLRSAFCERERTVTSIDWNWDAWTDLGDFPSESVIIVCKVPLNDCQWRVLKQLRERYRDPSRVIGIHELILPLTTIQFAQSTLSYYLKTLEDITPYYTGQKYFGPIDKLDEIFPLSGKNVIEFGPFDGCQTAGLLHAGVKKVTCIEARAENFIKVMVARYVFKWDNLELVMDDFHNVDNLKYGSFDLAFAHGVYYHSIAPFLFFENLLSLSNNIFLGGFCATDFLPRGDFQIIDYRGKEYRVKRYEECDNFTAGVNRFGYFFHKNDLMSFFRERNCEIVIISDEESTITAGNYIRFLASKRER